MTCRHANRLMERVLDGEGDDAAAVELQEHVSGCVQCGEAWQAARQVREALKKCDPPEPGEAYYHEATASIMARVAAVASRPKSAEGSSIVGSMRYGPLPVRGVAAGFVLTLGLLVGAFVSPADSVAGVVCGQGLGFPRLTPLPAAAGPALGFLRPGAIPGHPDHFAAERHSRPAPIPQQPPMVETSQTPTRDRCTPLRSQTPPLMP